MQLSSLLFLLCVGFSGAAVFLEYQKPQPGSTPFCFDKVKRKVGEEWHDLKACVRKMCLTDSQGTPLISHSSCGSVGRFGNCNVVTPTDQKPYPECCPKVVCSETDKEA